MKAASLTVFPGVWNPLSISQGALELQEGMNRRQGGANDWTALGFDFVQLAAALGLNSPGWDPASLNARLASNLNVAWAGAPMAWDRQGKASRNLFLFQPAHSGMVPLNQQAFREYYAGGSRLPNVETTGVMTGFTQEVPEELRPQLEELLQAITGSPAGQARQAGTE